MKPSPFTHLIVALAVGTLAFYGGTLYQRSQTPPMDGFTRDNRADLPRPSASGQVRQFTGGERPVVGQIVTVNPRGITLQLADGNTKLILVTDSTTLNQTTPVDREALQPDQAITVFGTANADGSLSATTVNLGARLGNN